MTHTTKKATSPIQSPHAALQAMLPRLKALGMRSRKTPFFDNQLDVADFLDDQDAEVEYYIVPVWAIDHRDLESSRVIKWTYSEFLN